MRSWKSPQKKLRTHLEVSFSFTFLFLAELSFKGYGKTISKVLVTLKTLKGTRQLRLDPG